MEDKSLDEFNTDILLLGLYKRQGDETFNDAIDMLISSGVFSKKESKVYMKELKTKELIQDEHLTMMGITKAQAVEAEFKI